MLKCHDCGFIGEDDLFDRDWYWDEEENDELMIYICPRCKNDNPDEIEEIEDNAN